jgi:hypothetical protein
MSFRAVLLALVCVGSTACIMHGSDEDVGSDSANLTKPARASGKLGAWQPVTPMPTPRANHCSAAIGGYLVVVGGNFKTDTGFRSTDEVHVARMNPDGTLGAWKLAGRTPSPVAGCTTASHGDTLFLLDGFFDDPSAGARVWSATLSKTGELTAFAERGVLPAATRLFSAEAWVEGSTLFAMRSKLPNEGNSVTLLQTSLDGELAWSERDWLSGFRGRPQYAHSAGYLYTLGGYVSGEGNPVISDASGAARSDATFASSFDTSALPAPRAFGTAIAVDDWVFLVGGKDAIFTASGNEAAFASRIGEDGSLGKWSAQPSLPEGRTSHSLTLGGDFLYVTGGGYDSGGLAAVYAARVKF